MCQQTKIIQTLDLLSVETDRLRQMETISQGQFAGFSNLMQQALDGLQSDHTRIHNELCGMRHGLIDILDRLKHS